MILFFEAFALFWFQSRLMRNRKAGGRREKRGSIAILDSGLKLRNEYDEE